MSTKSIHNIIAQTMPRPVGAHPSLGAPFQFIQVDYGDLESRIFAPVNLKLWKDHCDHDLKPYQGFTESYKYCTKCDYKEAV